MDVMARRRAIMAHVARLVKKIISSVTGLVSFTTNVIRPVKVTCEFSPVQEGTGDPSPDNVRPISGWTGCEIGHTGKNLFDGTVTNARIQNGVVVATGSYRLSEYIRVNPDTSYALVDKDGNLSQIFAHFFDENKTFLQSITTTGGIVVSPAGASYMRFHVTARAFEDEKPYMFFEGSTATAYEPYQGETIQINWKLPDEYQEVEYLESNGNQYFYSDIDIQDGLTVDSVQSYNRTTDMYLFGGYVTNGRSTFNGGWSDRIEGGYPSSYYLTDTKLDKTINTVYHIVTTHANGTITVYRDGNLIKNTSGLASIEADGSKCAVFGNKPAAGGEPNYKYNGRVYSLKVSKNMTMLADFVPCYRKSDNKPGMYDLVTGTFFINQGTGADFTVGPDASTLPGTVYGGTVTLNEDGSADLVLTKHGTTLGNIDWVKYTADVYTTFRVSINNLVFDPRTVTVMCDTYTPLSWNAVRSSSDNVIYTRSPNYLCIKDTSQASKTVEEFKTDNASVVIVYDIVIPVTYHFDNIGQLNSFLGENNVWHDMNDQITVEYYNYQ